MRLTAATICSIGCEQMCFCSAFVSRSDAGLGERRHPALVQPDRHLPLGERLPHRLVRGIVEVAAADRVRPGEHAAEPEVVVDPQHFGGRGVGILQRDHADAVQPLAVAAAEVGEPVVVRAARGRRRSPGRARCSRSRTGRTTGRGTRGRRPRRPCRRVARRRRSRARTRRGRARRTWPRCARRGGRSAPPTSRSPSRPAC